MINNTTLQGVRVLTTDAESRLGLYAIRYLGKSGAEVTAIGGGANPRDILGFRSKYITRKINLQKEYYYKELERIIHDRSTYYDIINPISTASMRALLRMEGSDKISSKYLLPKIESLRISDNKELLTTYASEIGLDCPRTFYRKSPDEVATLHLKGLTFPCIIKFRGDKRSSHWQPEERYSIVYSPKELVAEYVRMNQIEDYPIIQEYIHGQGYGYFALYDRDKHIRAHFCHKRIREYPITGGPSSCCESVYDDELVKVGRRLLDSLEWSGLAMVEMKYDKIRNKFYIIEVNPRYWGSLPLAVISGVNFPVLHALSVLNVDYEPVLEYATGTKLRFIHKDIFAILDYMKFEKNFIRKTLLFADIFNLRIADGLISLDDLGPVMYSFIKYFLRK